MRRATSRASTALNARLKPQLNHELTRAKSVTHATAARGVDGTAASQRISRPIGGELAST